MVSSQFFRFEDDNDEYIGLLPDYTPNRLTKGYRKDILSAEIPE